MVIKKIESFLVYHKLNEVFSFSQWRYDDRMICLVKITTDSGLYGWGEGYGPAKIIQSGIDFYTPLLVGKDPLQQENVWQAMYLRSLDYARRGVLLSALSAIDIALWDLKGKILQQPISVLLGGRRRDKVNVYATGMYFTDVPDIPAHLAEEAVGYKNQGFKAMKMKIGLGIKEDITNVAAVRDAIGPGIDLMIDSNHAYSLQEAVRLSHALEQYNIRWFEEPLSPEDYDGYRKLREKTSIPVAAGECEYLRAGFLHLLRNSCVDIAQPDICAAGGITEVKKISGLAQTFGVELAPHCWGTGVALSAALQLVSNLDLYPGRMISPEPILELDRTENPLRDELVEPAFTVNEGKLSVPDKPGLGIDIKEVLLNKYCVS
jgi:D-galactarolactone cycloisomerase